MKKVREGYKITEFGEIPEEWNISKLSEITELITKGATPMTYGFDFEDEGINFMFDDGIDTKALPLMAELLRYGREYSEFSILEGIMYDEWYRSLFELANELYGSNVYAYYFDLSFEETVRRHNTRNREFGEKDMRRWWREKDFSSVLREQAITCEMDTDSIVEKIYSDLNADRKAIAFMSI